MGRRYALLALVLILVSALHAQGLVLLTNDQGQVVNGSVIHKPLTPGYDTDTVKLNAVLAGAMPRSVNVRRYEVWPIEGSKNFFCWGVCYLPVTSGVNTTWDSQHWVDMTPGSVYNNFSAYYMPEGQVGTTRFRYVWYDMDDPNGADSSWVEIDFGGSVGIAEQLDRQATMETWPNPNSGSDISIFHSLGKITGNTHLVIYNVLGEQVSSMRLRNAEGLTTLPASSLTTGVYFANLEQDGRILATRKLVVTR